MSRFLGPFLLYVAGLEGFKDERIPGRQQYGIELYYWRIRRLWNGIRFVVFMIAILAIYYILRKRLGQIPVPIRPAGQLPLSARTRGGVWPHSNDKRTSIILFSS